MTSAELDGATLSPDAFEATPERFALKSPPAEKFELRLCTNVAPDENTALMGLYRSSGVYCTQCEAEGFRRFTYAYDRPDVLCTYDTTIVADGSGQPVLLSNGNLVEAGERDGRAFARWEDPFPKPSYLFALVAGELGVLRDTFQTMSGRTVELGIYVEPGKEPRAAYAMEALKRSMAWDETRFGREYDLDVFNIVAVSDFNFGAMENKGLNIFNDKYILADPTVATDLDYANIEAIIAHEYFHNWTGNRITCRDWFQLCLKEGLTVFRDQEFTADVRSRGVKRIEDVRRLRLAQFREDASALRHPVRPSQYAEISNLYTATVYEKGAELVRMIHTLIGEDRFRVGMDHYFDRHDGTAATVEDFLGSFEDLDTAPFLRWYNEPGTPTVRVDETFEDGVATLSFTQLPAEGASFKPVPIRLALKAASGSLPLEAAQVENGQLRSDTLVMDGERASLVLDGLSEAPVASVFRGFSAPVVVARAADETRDLALLERDDDPFSAWDAAQRLMMARLQSAYDGEPFGTATLADALGDLATADRLEPAMRALMLTLPPRVSLVEAIASNVDAEKIDRAHREFTAAMGGAMQGPMKVLADAPAPQADDVSAVAAGKRALQNAAIHLLAMGGDTALAIDRAYQAPAMTDRLAALNALTAAGASEADPALARFHDDFADEPLVLDKYFAIQAQRTDGDPLQRTKALMEHSKFSLKRPNRVRSLVGAFTQNIPAFHAADGSGYGFLADRAQELDGINPQVAARLLTVFGDVRRYEPTRRAAAKIAVEAVGSAAKSSDVGDIVRRLLAAWETKG
ncbi:MAG: aminopeptidase N [Pseudomonadota bacterium]